MVFDEIDAGIGGTTAHAVAETLRRLAERAQVVTITHLPQIATVADRHFSVEKMPGDPTHTRIEPLDDAQRRDELERMLGGAEFLATIDAAPDGGEHGRPGAARPAGGRLGVPRRAVPPPGLVARHHGRRAGPARLRARRPLEGAGDQAQRLHRAPARRDDAARPRDRPLRALDLAPARAAADTEVRLRATAPDRTLVTVTTSSRVARAAVQRLYDLVQTAARL